jgi:hypothetical protein
MRRDSCSHLNAVQGTSRPYKAAKNITHPPQFLFSRTRIASRRDEVESVVLYNEISYLLFLMAVKAVQDKIFKMISAP